MNVAQKHSNCINIQSSQSNIFYLIDPVGDMRLTLKVHMVPKNSIDTERRMGEEWW
jgi:hypothetical protein